MLFDVRAALAEILNEAPARCDTRDFCDTTPAKSQESRKSQSQSCAVEVPAGASTWSWKPTGRGTPLCDVRRRR